MSLLNVVVRNNVGWMCVDTQTRIEEDGRFSTQSKMLPLVHVNAVVGCRGDITFLPAIFHAFMDEPVGDFDALAEVWSDRLNVAMECYRNRAEKEGFDPHKIGSHVALVGWSSARGKPFGLVALRDDGADSFRVGEITGRPCIGPNPGHDVPHITNLDAMKALAREQVRKMRREHPGEPIGGRLLLAEVWRARMKISELAMLG